METLVAIDIETTGLNPSSDAIIEIGAVRFKDRRVEDEWTTLVHPGCRIPPFITQLTGITDAMVVNAPAIQDIIHELASFVGDSCVVGHNIRFDLGFLRKQRILLQNDMIDTYELAAFLLPGAERYNLSALGQALAVPFPATHRALDDAHATRGIYLRLFDELMQLPIHLFSEIIQLGEHLDWGANRALLQAFQRRTQERKPEPGIRYSYTNSLFGKIVDPPAAPLQPIEEPLPLDEEEVASILEPGSIFSKHFPYYEYRSQQVAMLRAVTQALSEGRHLLVEAGTGTGKSMAYLTPAALWATKNQRRVVISTNTINLQDQLIHKDIPDLRAALDLNIRATVLKGRGNYLCPRRLESLRRRGPNSIEEMRILAKILVWLQGTQTGDRGEINLNGPMERQVWSRISAEDEGCTADNCMRHTGGACPFYRARQAALSAHLIIVNHALLLADIATGSRVLPEYEYLVVDEAHHLEDATTNALSFHITQSDVERLLHVLGGPNTGTLGWLLNATQSILDPAEFASLNYLVQRTTDYAFQLENLAGQFFTTIDRFLHEQREGREMGMYSHQERIVQSTRIQPSWAEVESVWDEADQILVPLVDTLGKIILGLGEINQFLSEDDEELYGVLTNLFRRLRDFQVQVNGLVFEPSPERVYWVEAHADNNQFSLHSSPLHIGPLMEQYIWNEKASVILTSATLTTAGEFDYIRGRLSAEHAYELALGSPFDYETSTLLYVVDDIPEPSDRNAYQRAFERGLTNLCIASGGRTLVLFTSYDQLRRTSHAISMALSKEDIMIYEQGDGASPHSLLESFRNTERAVLLGTRAFWEGVDVPGEALSVLVIAKLPFDVPSDPIIAARSETFEDSFYQYSLPEAILRLRQGFGRLIRTQYDRGVVAIFDRRILTKGYGRFFMESLPTCHVHVGSIANLPRTAQQWLNL